MPVNKVIAVFDIGKTNKKVLLFDENLHVIHQEEKKLPTTIDDDGFECDDIDLLENWISSSIESLNRNSGYDIKAINFSTYGASLIFLNKEGKRLAPLYNYLKEVDLSIQEKLFDSYGGETEFCRKTASPPLGLLLNSGIQILWLKHTRSEVFNKVQTILHLPQYLSYRLTGKIVSEPTSIGCHTFMWDFDKNKYHQWINDHGISLPEPEQNTQSTNSQVSGKEIAVGIGIHDSSSSLAPYLIAEGEPFLLVSTGTWCINMNPFNHTPLTAEELNKDCLSYLSVNQQAVKSSRLYMGHIHDENTKRISAYFDVPEDTYKCIGANEKLMAGFLSEGREKRVFFTYGVPAGYLDKSVDLSRFSDFSEAYQRMMFDLSALNANSIDLVIDRNDEVKKIYISGGFARNELFVRTLAGFYPDKEVFTSQVDNSSALGAALMVWNAAFGNNIPGIDLGLKKWEAFSY